MVFAHGYVNPIPARPPELPLDQYFLSDGTTPMAIPDMVNLLGYAFATTSYHTNGLAIKDGVADLVQLVDHFNSQHPSPSPHVYVFGASEGGLITAKAIEEQPNKFSGGVAACGPVGDFRKQIDYLGDFRVVFDYFYPDVIHGSAIQISKKVISEWDDLQPAILAAVSGDRAAASQLLSVTQAAIDLADSTSPFKTTTGVLWYNVFATNDAKDKLGGHPFDNSARINAGSLDDTALNEGVERYGANKKALSNVDRYYQTSGSLSKPLALLHNRLDPVVPYWHEALYAAKVGVNQNYALFTAESYGHCAFATYDIMAALQWVVLRSGGSLFATPQAALPNPEAYRRYLELTRDLRP